MFSYDIILLIIILLLCIVIFKLYKLLPFVFINGGNDDVLKIHKTGSGEKTILLIPGLGNGIESYNWNFSTEDQRKKTNINYNIESLQEKIKGYKVITFDPPGHGENLNYPVPKNINEYITLLNKLDPNIDLVVGHSIGALIAQAYGNKYNCKYIMLDPTPDYILNSINYKKHLEDPANIKYQKTYEYLSMIKSSFDNEKLNPYVIIYSIDDIDSGKTEKEKYFDELNVQKRKLINATHWVHITNPDILLEYINQF